MFGSFPPDLLSEFKEAYEERRHAMAIGYPQQSYTDKEDLACNKPKAESHNGKSHVVRACGEGLPEGGKLIRFGQAGASTAGKPKEGESDRMKAKRASFKARHGRNIAKGPSSAAYWADKVKW
jgi:hypothetical protein